MLAMVIFFDSALQRTFQAGDVHSYRIHVETDELTPALKYDFTFWTRCKKPSADSGTQQLEVEVRNLHEHSGKMSVHRSRAGIGTMALGTTGLPPKLRDSVPSEAFWAPLLAFYLPAQVDYRGAFDSTDALGANSTLDGKGTAKDGAYDFDGSVDGPNGAKSSLKLIWTVDETGWLISGEGTLIDPSGTITFKVDRE
jgi:hypothetical protein